MVDSVTAADLPSLSVAWYFLVFLAGFAFGAGVLVILRRVPGTGKKNG